MRVILCFKFFLIVSLFVYSNISFAQNKKVSKPKKLRKKLLIEFPDILPKAIELDDGLQNPK